MIHFIIDQSLLHLLLLLRLAALANPLPRDLLGGNQGRVEADAVAEAQGAVELGVSSYYSLADGAVVVASQPAGQALDVVQMAASDLQVHQRVQAKRAGFLLLGLEAFTFVPGLIEPDFHLRGSLGQDHDLSRRVLDVGKQRPFPAPPDAKAEAGDEDNDCEADSSDHVGY